MSDEIELVPMPKMTVADAAALAEWWLGRVLPEHLVRPGPLDVVRLVDHELGTLGKHGMTDIHVVPVDASELPGEEAKTQPFPRNVASGPITILVREDQWEMLHAGGRASHRPRATIAHEVSHAMVHVPYVRERFRRSRARGEREIAFNRVSRRQIPFDNCPEEQAWRIGGSLLMPPSTLRMMDVVDARRVAAAYGVSVPMAENHLRRLNRGGILI